MGSGQRAELLLAFLLWVVPPCLLEVDGSQGRRSSPTPPLLGHVRPWHKTLTQTLDYTDNEDTPQDLESNSKNRKMKVMRVEDSVDPVLRKEENSEEDYDDEATENKKWNFDYDWHENNYKIYKNYVKHAMFSDVYQPQFLIENRRLCDRRSKIFVFINTRVNNTRARQAIRESYLKDLLENNIPYGFLLSNPEDRRAMRSINDENDKFKDLIVLESKETYYHLTLKTAHLLQWAAHNCPASAYIVKMDDDVYVNVARLLQVLDGPRNHTVLGKVCTNCVPVRGGSLGTALRLYSNVVTLRHSPLTRFPPFAMGPAYVITADVIPLLLEAAQEMAYFSYEDVFWTGLAVEVINCESGINLGVAEDPDSILEKFRKMRGGRPPATQVRREDVAGWRVDRRRPDPLTTALAKARHAVIVHGINWHEDRHLVLAMQDMAKEN